MNDTLLRCRACGHPALPGVVAAYACGHCGERNPYAPRKHMNVSKRDSLILLDEDDSLGSPERTDALLDELNEIRATLEVTPRWRIFRRHHLMSDLLAYTGELQHNERVRAKRDP